MNDERYEALQTCLVAIEHGQDPDECLESLPDLAGELRPILKVAIAAKSLADDPIPEAAFHRSRTRLLGKAAQLRSQKSSRFPLFGRFPRLVLVALALALVFFMSWKGMVESAKALPGDPLYSIKRGAEDIRLQIAPDRDAKRAIKVRYEQRRVDEVIKLLLLNRVVQVNFEGILDEISADYWNVEGIPIRLAPDAQVIGLIEVGQVVEVNGQTQTNGEVLASTIRLHSYQLIGDVDSMSPNQWVVSGEKLIISSESQIDPATRVNDRVIVLVEVKSDGRLQAQAILRLLQPELVSTIIPPVGDLGNSSEGHQEIDEVEIYGEVGALSSTLWTIAGRQVQVNPETEIKGDITIGDRVKVHAFYSADGVLVAREIEMDTSIMEDQNQQDNEELITGDDHSSDDHHGEEDSSTQEEDHSGSSKDKNDGESSIGSSDDDHSGSGGGDDSSSEDHHDSDNGGKGGDDGESDDHKDSEESTSFELQPWLVNSLLLNI